MSLGWKHFFGANEHRCRVYGDLFPSLCSAFAPISVSLLMVREGFWVAAVYDLLFAGALLFWLVMAVHQRFQAYRSWDIALFLFAACGSLALVILDVSQQSLAWIVSSFWSAGMLAAMLWWWIRTRSSRGMMLASPLPWVFWAISGGLLALAFSVRHHWVDMMFPSVQAGCCLAIVATLTRNDRRARRFLDAPVKA